MNDDKNNEEIIKTIALIALLHDPKFIYNKLIEEHYDIDEKAFIRAFHFVNEYEIDPECDEKDNILNIDEVEFNKDLFLEKFAYNSKKNDEKYRRKMDNK